ncbi:hypothetical protein [Scytonema sp. PRP1]|uniref:hypothetical protein n=1 Tax=Scytonema sp. PRP1 TaxID=3120513 RepID=UPI002FD67BC0
MTSRAAETQQLIADIDRLITNKRLSRFLSTQASEPRQVLERIRDFLVSLSENDAQTQPQESPLVAKFVEHGSHQSLPQQNEKQEEGAYVVAGQESNALAAVLAPLQEEIKTLLQERANLVEEIRQLEQKRLHNYSLAQQLANQEQIISEFLQVLSSRVVPNSTQQLAETTTSSEMPQFFKIDTAPSLFASHEDYTEPATASTPPDQMEHLSRLARDLDQKLLALDGTVNVVFEALQRNIHTYEESLSQALARMHSKGVQGEQLLASLISNLTSQLQQPTLTNEPLKDLKDETATESQDLASELVEFQQAEASSSLTQNQSISLEAQETGSTSDLDAVFQHTQEEQSSTIETPPNTSRIHRLSSGLIRDEIDQLYASLFGIEVTNDTDKLPATNNEVININEINEINELFEPTVTSSKTDVATEAMDRLSAPDSSEINELFEEPTITPLAVTTDQQTDVTDKLSASVTNEYEVTSIINDLFEPTVTPLATNEVTDVTDVATEVTDATNQLSIEPTVNPPADTPPLTATHQLPSEGFLYEVTFEAPEVATHEARDVTDEFSENVTTPSSVSHLSETPLEGGTNQEKVVNATVELPDPWSEEPQAGLLEPSSNDAKDTQDVSLATEQSSTLQENTFAELPPGGDREAGEKRHHPQVVSFASTTSSVSPASEDTITVLSELLLAISDAEQLLEMPSSAEALITTPVTSEVVETPPQITSRETSQVEIQNPDLEQSSNNDIPASPEENLLFQEEQSTEMFDISLEEAQLQQLEQDLASFDGEINALLQPLTQPENLENPPESLSPLPQQAETEPDPIATEAHAAEIENKSIVKETVDGSSVSISHSSNDTDVPHEQNTPKSIWYLGIDLGTTGISAALLNRSTSEVYPLYWSAETQPEATSVKRSFRLPAEVYLPTASVSGKGDSGLGIRDWVETESKEAQEQIPPAPVAEEKVPEDIATGSTLPESAAVPTQNLFSAQLKPYLHIALPYKSDRSYWEPVLQLNEFSTVPLVWVVRSLSKLLLTFTSDRSSTTLGLTAGAVGLDQETFQSIISNITGVICTCPSNWSEQYRFNIREALLISKLVQHPQQVFFVEEGIACLLCELDGAEGEIVKIRGRQGFRPARSSDREAGEKRHRPLVGNTLVINIGAGATEMALVDLPENLEDLSHSNFMLHGFAYAGKGLEQDIICQLLFPSKWRQPRMPMQEDNKTVTSNPSHWQPAIPGLEQMRFSSLGLEELNLPRPGEADIMERIRLQQRLESSLLGKAVIDSAIALKLILQHQESFTLELADQRWVLQRRDLESQVFVPFVRRLNRELNKLLVAKGIPTEAINQAILTGGVASLGAVSRWLRQKLPNAKIIQDVYLGENGSPSCSRVAYGLAVLPLHPQVVEVPRQQYTDYFLFTELLRIFPTRAISFGEVIELFENRGINTRSCQQRLLAFLEGELPPGLIPTSLDAISLTQASSENADYKAMSAAPLFEKQGSLTYRPNVEQLRVVAHYLDCLKASIQQSLEEPYTVNFALGVVD